MELLVTEPMLYLNLYNAQGEKEIFSDGTDQDQTTQTCSLILDLHLPLVLVISDKIKKTVS